MRKPPSILSGAAFLLVGCDDSSHVVEDGILEPPWRIESPEALIEALETSYRTRDIDLFASLLANPDVHGVGFVFCSCPEAPQGQVSWGYEEEVRIHRRMFEPENPEPGEDPLPPDVWLQSIDLSLTRQTDFEPHPDLCPGDDLDELDPQRWLASGARYSTSVFLQTQGQTDFRVEGMSIFVVIEDLSKEVGDDGKFLLYRWIELEPSGIHRSGDIRWWSEVKGLYR
ncbi:MAG: hypothetical protein ACE5G2_06510 [Candidatus Krumholzibacteriia bacterium]